MYLLVPKIAVDAAAAVVVHAGVALAVVALGDAVLHAGAVVAAPEVA